MKTQTQTSCPINQSLEAFTMDLSLSRSKLTMEAYSYDVSKFLEFIKERKIKKLNTIKAEHVTLYLGQCRACGKSDSTLNRYFTSIREFFKFLKRMKIVPEDITSYLTPPRS